MSFCILQTIIIKRKLVKYFINIDTIHYLRHIMVQHTRNLKWNGNKHKKNVF